MHESEQRGKLLLNGKPMPEEALARLLGLDKQVLTKALTTILDTGVASREAGTGALINRRMVRDEETRQKRAKCGKLGGNPILLKQNPTTVVNQIGTPSSSVSVSSSDKKPPNPQRGQSADLERVYAAYPLKVGKPKAMQAIARALVKFGLAHVLSRTEQFAKARNGDTAFMPHPTTWFNQERFNDDPTTWKREDNRPTGAKGFDRNKGTCNEGKAAQYDLGRIQAAEPVQDPGS